MVSTVSAEDVSQRGNAIYRDKIRNTLTEADKGKYIIINTVSGEWVAGDDLEATEQEARKRFLKGQQRYTIRVGYKAAFSLRPGLNMELTEW